MKAFLDNTQFGAAELGAIVWAWHKQRFDVMEFEQRFGHDCRDEVIPFLMSRQVLVFEDDTDITNTNLVFVGERKREKVLSDLEAQFEEFRVAYRKVGTVGGFGQMFKVLQKHKDWRDAIPMLMPTFEKEKAYKHWLRKSNRFCPEWKNLQTWLNQRCWENEYDTGETASEWTDTALFKQYLESLGSLTLTMPYYLTEEQYREWTLERGNFEGISKRISPQRRSEVFFRAHRELVNHPDIVAKNGGLFGHLVKTSKE